MKRLDNILRLVHYKNKLHKFTGLTSVIGDDAAHVAMVGTMKIAMMEVILFKPSNEV